ncbi:unnamed protein product [Brassica oleracea]
MKSVISVIFLCVLMFCFANIVKAKLVQKYLCNWYGSYSGKCGPDGNKKCQDERKVSIVTFERCDCVNTIFRKKDYHDCTCYIKPPCRKN